MKKDDRDSFGGFTLVEVLVVMAIIAVLIGISVAGLGYAMRRSRNISRQSAMSNLDRSLEAYYSDNLDYPTEGEIAGDSMNDLITEDGDVLYEYLEGSWEAPPETEVYYKSSEILFTVCVNQEEAAGAVSWVCTGPGIGDPDFPEREIPSSEPCCTGCTGECSVWSDGSFSGSCTGCVGP